MFEIETVAGKRYVRDKKKHLVPEESLTDEQKLLETDVDDLAAAAVSLQSAIDKFQQQVMNAVCNHCSKKLPPDTEVMRDDLLAQSCDLVSFNGKTTVSWVTAMKCRVDDQAVTAIKARLRVIIDSIGDPLAKKAVAKLMHVDKGRKFDYGMVKSISDLNIDHPDWDSCRTALFDAIKLSDRTSNIRVYHTNADGNKERLPLKVCDVSL